MSSPISLLSLSIENADGTTPQIGVFSLQIADGKLLVLVRKSFRFRTSVFREIPLSDIANVRCEKGVLTFSELKDGKVVCNLSMVPEKGRSQEILDILPDRVVSEMDSSFATAQKELSDYQEALDSNVGAPWLTYALMAVCIGVFIWMCVAGVDPLDPTPEDLLAVGGNFAPATLFGEWWRLLSSGFVHCGLVHLAFNMYVLFAAGRQAERLFGHLLYAMVYLGALLGGSLVSIAVHDNVISAGASGALFGIFGATFAYMLRNRGAVPDRIRKETLKNVGLCIVYNLAYGMKAGIDNWCHVGGLAAGFACGLVAAFPPKVTDRDSAILPRFLLLAALIPAIAFPVYRDLKGRLGPLMPALIQCDAIVEQFRKDHPDAFEFSDDDADPDTVRAFLETYISGFLTPQIDILETVPRDSLTPEKTRILDAMLQIMTTRRTAMSLHAKALQTGDDSLASEINDLYQKAADMEAAWELDKNDE